MTFFVLGKIEDLPLPLDFATAVVPIIQSVDDSHLKVLATTINQVEGGATIDTKEFTPALSAVITGYQNAPIEAKASIVALVPPQLKPLVPLVEHLPPKTMTSLAVTAIALKSSETNKKSFDINLIDNEIFVVLICALIAI